MHCPECGKERVVEDASYDYYLHELYHCENCDTEFYCIIVGTKSERLAELNKIIAKPSKTTSLDKLLKDVYLRSLESELKL